FNAAGGTLPASARPLGFSPPPLTRLADFDLFVLDEELRRTAIGPADHRDQPHHLLARDQSQRGALRTRKNGPVWVFVLAHVTGILQHEQRPRPHLLRDPFAQDVEFRDHLPSVERLATDNGYDARPARACRK